MHPPLVGDVADIWLFSKQEVAFQEKGNYSGQPFFQRETRDSFPRRGKESRVSREILIWA